jgi:hypothetical protein
LLRGGSLVLVAFFTSFPSNVPVPANPLKRGRREHTDIYNGFMGFLPSLNSLRPGDALHPAAAYDCNTLLLNSLCQWLCFLV